MRIRLATGDVVEDFGNLLGASPARVARVNASIDGSLVRALQRLRSFRLDPHDPSFEFLFARWAPGPKKPLTWVIPCEDCRDFLRDLRPHNMELLELAEASEAQRIRDDPRWWDCDACEEKTVEPAEFQELRSELSEELLAGAFRALQNCAAGLPAID